MFYLLILGLGAVGIGIYLLVIFREVPGAVEERLGRYEALPEDVGQWRADDESSEGKAALEQGLRREVRLWHETGSGLLQRERLVQQVRYRNLWSNSIERVEPDLPLKRKRVKA